MRAFTPRVQRAFAGLVLSGLVAACADASGEEAHASLGSGWPLSEIAAPASDSGDATGSPTGEAVAAHGGGGTVAGSVADPGSEAASGGPDGSVRPEMDMDASGPMIHPEPREIRLFPDARFARPDHIRGLYVNAWAAGSRSRMDAILDLARRTEINTLVIDIKDATGYVSHRTRLPLAHESGATGEVRIPDLSGLLDRLEEEGIYPIARIVVVKDPILSAHRPDLAVQDTAGGVWIDSKDIIWMNPYSRGVWEYNTELAREVAMMGFPEIQWDYIRFPDAPEEDMNRAVFTGGDGIERVEAIRGFLTYARDNLADLPVRSTADVFGVTTSFRRDIGLGQLWESFIDVVDAALPMVYPSHYWAESFGYDHPNAYPYEVVRAALRDAQQRSATVDGAGLTRPWIQDFSLGEPVYGGPEVRAQIQATYDVGIQEWILWNPGSRYSESALEPVGGFESEPLIRVAGMLAPVSRRHAVIDSIAALPPSVDTLPVDLPAGEDVPVDTLWFPRVDTLAVDTLAVDTLTVDTLTVDTLAVISRR